MRRTCLFSTPVRFPRCGPYLISVRPHFNDARYYVRLGWSLTPSVFRLFFAQPRSFFYFSTLSASLSAWTLLEILLESRLVFLLADSLFREVFSPMRPVLPPHHRSGATTILSFQLTINLLFDRETPQHLLLLSEMGFRRVSAGPNPRKESFSMFLLVISKP